MNLWSLLEKIVLNGYTFAWGADVSEKGFGYRDNFKLFYQKMNQQLRKKGNDNKIQ